jgi:hypothetical protein
MKGRETAAPALNCILDPSMIDQSYALQQTFVVFLFVV